MRCLDDDIIVDFVDGRLSSDHVRALEEHAATCPDCSALLAGVGRALAEDPGWDSLAPTATRVLAELAPGSRIAHYVIDRDLGRGSMARVVAAYDARTEREVAIKVLAIPPGDPARDDELRRRFDREVRALSRLEHPNVLPILDHGTSSDQPYLVTEVMSGGTVDQWLARSAPSWQQIVEVFVAVGRGLHAAHGAGFIHRDVKPTNIMLASDGTPVLTDFGLAGYAPEATDDPHSITQMSRSGQLLGTPRFMAPEQLLGTAADARSDQFSLAASLYQALYRQLPFAGLTFAELCASVVDGRLTPPPASSEVPGPVFSAVARALAADPGQRFSSVGEFVTALERTVRPTNRARSIAIVAGIGLVLGVIAAIIVGWLRG